MARQTWSLHCDLRTRQTRPILLINGDREWQDRWLFKLNYVKMYVVKSRHISLSQMKKTLTPARSTTTTTGSSARALPWGLRGTGLTTTRRGRGRAMGKRVKLSSDIFGSIHLCALNYLTCLSMLKRLVTLVLLQSVRHIVDRQQTRRWKQNNGFIFQSELNKAQCQRLVLHRITQKRAPFFSRDISVAWPSLIFHSSIQR